MEYGDEQTAGSNPQPDPCRPNRSPAWMQLTYEYLQALPGQLDDVMGLLPAQDWAAIRHIAHRAKGTSGTYGLRPIAKKFGQLEEAAETRPREDIAELVVTIRHLIETESAKLRPWVAPCGRDQRGDADG